LSDDSHAGVVGAVLEFGDARRYGERLSEEYVGVGIFEIVGDLDEEECGWAGFGVVVRPRTR
jgi:hypothetical protein